LSRLYYEAGSPQDYKVIAIFIVTEITVVILILTISRFSIFIIINIAIAISSCYYNWCILHPLFLTPLALVRRIGHP
jgi:hypothetical protein